MRKESKFFIIGSSGLIGSKICSILKKKKIKYFHSDKNLDITKDKFIKHLKKKKPNILINCSSHPGGLSFKDPAKNLEVNYLANVKIADWCSKNNCKFIFLSSSAVYGNRNKKIKITENDFTDPQTIYGINKLSTEKFLINFSKYKKLNWLILRLFATYGSGHKLNNYQGIINVILNQVLKNNNTVVLKGSKNRTRSLIHVFDASEIIIKLALSNKKNQIYNVASPEMSSIREIIGKISNILNKKLKIKEKSSTLGDPLHNIADIRKLNKFLKYKFKYNLHNGLVQTIENIKI